MVYFPPIEVAESGSVAVMFLPDPTKSLRFWLQAVQWRGNLHGVPLLLREPAYSYSSVGPASVVLEMSARLWRS